MLLFKEHEVFPSKEVLQNELGSVVYCILEEMEAHLRHEEFDFTLNWYYSDKMNLWLCKVCQNNRNVFWYSVGCGSLKTIFVIAPKDLDVIAGLDIDEQMKEDFLRAKPIGRLLTVSINVCQKKQLGDLLTIAKFKKSINSNNFSIN